MMPPFKEAPVRWLVVSIVMVFLSLAVIGLAVWNITLVQNQSEIEKQALSAKAQVVAIRAARQAEKRAAKTSADTSRVNRCLVAVETVPDAVRVLSLLGTLTRNQVESAKAAIRLDPTDPLTKQRRIVIARAEPSLKALGKFIRQTQAGQRTRGQCEELAEKLGVDIESLRGEATNAE